MVKMSQKTKLWLMPVVAITFVVVGTIILVAFAQGYTYDSSSGHITTSGLVLIDSNPNNAMVYVNGKDTHKKTPYRYANAKAGDINVQIKKDQYRLWSSELKVVAGEVTFADYSILLPDTLSQDKIDQPKQYATVVQSTDLRKTVAQDISSPTLYTLSNDGESKLLYQPVSVADPQKQVTGIERLQISANGDRLLFDQKLANNERQSLTIQLSDAKIDNLTTEYGFVFTDLRFNPVNSNELFWLEAGEVKKIRVAERSISANLVGGVANLNVSGDRLLVVKSPLARSPATSQQLSSYDQNGGDKKDIVMLPPDPKGYQVSLVRSRYNDYATIIHNTTGLFELIKDPYSSQHQTILRQGQDTTSVTASPNSRFLVINQSKTMRTIDLEFDQQYESKTSLDGLQNWVWYDNYHLVLLQGKQIRMVDFDGQNNQLLTPIADVSAMSIQPGNKNILPLNDQGSLYKLWLIKK